MQLHSRFAENSIELDENPGLLPSYSLRSSRGVSGIHFMNGNKVFAVTCLAFDKWRQVENALRQSQISEKISHSPYLQSRLCICKIFIFFLIGSKVHFAFFTLSV